MIYYHTESKQWVALDPNGSRAYIGKSQQNAERAFEIYSGRSQGGITPAEADFLGGISAGVSPLGILLNPVHEAAGLDTTSREYAWGIGAGALISFGFGFVSEGANSIRVGRWMSQGEYEAMAKSGLVQESSLNGVTSVTLPSNSAAMKCRYILRFTSGF